MFLLLRDCIQQNYSSEYQRLPAALRYEDGQPINDQQFPGGDTILQCLTVGVDPSHLMERIKTISGEMFACELIRWDHRNHQSLH